MCTKKFMIDLNVKALAKKSSRLLSHVHKFTAFFIRVKLFFMLKPFIPGQLEFYSPLLVLMIES